MVDNDDAEACAKFWEILEKELFWLLSGLRGPPRPPKDHKDGDYTTIKTHKDDPKDHKDQEYESTLVFFLLSWSMN